MSISITLSALFNRIPRRYSVDNIKEINSLLTDYEDVLIEIEAVNSFYEKAVPPFFENIEAIKVNIKNATSSKASKKQKDDFFDDASCGLKDSVDALVEVWGDGARTN